MSKVATTIKINKQTMEDFYVMLIRLFGRTRGHVSECFSDALEMWIKAKESELEN